MSDLLAASKNNTRHAQLYRAAGLNPTRHGIRFHSKYRCVLAQGVNDLVAVCLIGSRARYATTGRRAVLPRQVHTVAFTRP